MNKVALSLLSTLAGVLIHNGAAQAQASGAGGTAPAASTASAASRLDEILARGTLRACTTGDYKPYSFYKTDGQFEGIDIDMTESLAKSRGV